MSAVSGERRGKDSGSARPKDPGPPSVTDDSTAAEPAEGGAQGESGAGEAPASARPAGKPGGAALTTAELQDRWLRAEADLRNFRRRATLEREEAWRSAEDGILLEMITMLDDLDRALDAARDAGAPESWTSGVQLTADRVRERLARFGVVTLDPVGKPFDPRFHEALLEVDAPANIAPGSVAQVVHRGYARGDRALRAARVVVARPPENEKEKAG
jgi:molecular chaperone GrpE